LNIAFLKRKSNPFGNRTSRIARLANGQAHHNPTWGVAPGYDEYRLWRKKPGIALGHRTSRPVRLANGQAHHNPTWGVAPGYDEYRLWRKKPGVAFAPSNIATGSIGQRPYTP
jgi:hypothetical protein